MAFLFNPSVRRGTPKPPPGATRHAVDALIDVAAIEGTLVRRKDGWYAALIEVEGESFGLLTAMEQDLRIESFGRVLNGLPDGWSVQVTRMVEPANLDPLADSLATVADREASNPLGVLATDWHQVVEQLSATVVHHTTVLTVWDKTPDAVQEKARHLLAGLTDAQFHAKLCDAERIGVLLQTAYGHPPVPLEAVMSPTGLTAGLRRYMQAPAKEAKPAPRKPRGRREAADPVIAVADADRPPTLAGKLPTLPDVLEPSAVLEMPGVLDLGGLYATTLVARTWPEHVENGWLEWLYGSEDVGVRRRVSFYLKALPTSRVLADLRRRQIQLDAETRWAHKRGMREDIDIELGEEAIEILRQELGRGRQKMFLATILVTLLADSPEQLRDAERRLMQKGAGYQVVLRPLYLEELPGFRATVPLGVQPVTGLPDRGVPTIALATTFPFSAGELMDPVGDIWGENRSTGSLVVLDPAQFDLRHLIVVAKSRSGKSMTIKTLATQALFRPDEAVIVIDPSPPIDYERWTRWLGGAYVRFGPGSADGINPLEIVVPASFDRVRDTDMAAPIRQKVAFGVELIGLMNRDELTPAERLALEDVLLAQFAAHGMAVPAQATPEAEWAAVLDRSPDQIRLTPQAKPAPTLTEVWTAMMEHPDLQAVALRIKPFVTGLFNMFAGPTTVDMSQRLIVFNVYGLIQGSAGRQHQAVAYAMIAEFIRWQLAQARRRTFVVVDEGHIMFQREDTAKFVSQLFRMAAKQGGRVALLTQGIVDIMGDPATGMSVPGEADARFCLENAGFKLLLRNDNDADIELIARTLGITPAEGRAIKGAKQGQGIVLVSDPKRGTHRAFVEVFVPRTLYPWITSNPAEVEAFRQQGLFAAIEGGREVLLPSDADGELDSESEAMPAWPLIP